MALLTGSRQSRNIYYLSSLSKSMKSISFLLSPIKTITRETSTPHHNKSGSEPGKNWGQKKPDWRFAATLGITAILLKHLWYKKSLLADEKTVLDETDKEGR